MRATGILRGPNWLNSNSEHLVNMNQRRYRLVNRPCEPDALPSNTGRSTLILPARSIGTLYARTIASATAAERYARDFAYSFPKPLQREDFAAEATHRLH